MKLISCHIANFGKLKDMTLQFKEGENVILENNGWGKSTLAAFIRAMFYGLSGERKRTETANERRRFRPWQNGVFGGQLTFETQGKTYTVYRVFGDREGHDEFRLIDENTGLVSADFSEKLGEELFKLDRESFMRTVFISQADCETAVTDDIHARISNLTDITGDMKNYDSANAALTTRINALTPDRKTGALYKRKEEILSLNRRIREAEGLEETLKAAEETLSGKEAEIRKTEETYKYYVKQQEILNAREKAESLKGREEELTGRRDLKKEKLKTTAAYFPGKVPEASEIRAAVNIYTEAQKKEERAEALSFSAEEKKVFLRLKETFAEGIPEEGFLTEVRKAAETLKDTKTRTEKNRPAEEEEARYQELKALYEEEQVTPEELTSAWEARLKKEQETETLEEILELKEEDSPGVKKGFGSVIFGAAACVTGALILLIRMTVSKGNQLLLILGITFVALGALLILLKLLAGNENLADHTEREALEERIRRLETQIEAMDRKLEKKLGIEEGSLNKEALESAVLLKIREYQEYERLREKCEDPGLQATYEQEKRIEIYLAEKLTPYGYPGEDLVSEAEKLYSDAEKYRALKLRQENALEAHKTYRDAVKEVTDFIKRCGLTVEQDLLSQLLTMRDELDEFSDASEEFVEASQDLSRFLEANEEALIQVKKLLEETEVLPVSKEVLKYQAEDLLQRKDELVRESYELKERITDLTERRDQAEEDRDTLSRLMEQQETEEKAFRLMKIAREKLENAKTALTNKYADPLFKSFSLYYEMITQEGASDYHLDANIHLSKEEQGLPRSTAALSTGYRDLTGICLRCALAEAMFQEERPFLILDDPFTNLDDEKLKRARVFLKQLAERYQVIYLTCAEVRK